MTSRTIDRHALSSGAWRVSKTPIRRFSVAICRIPSVGYDSGVPRFLQFAIVTTGGVFSNA